MPKTRLLLPLALLAAAPGVALRPGLWEITRTPGAATLDGRPLADLPYTPAPPAAPTCMTAAMLAESMALPAREMPAGCRETRNTRTARTARIEGICAPQAPGLAAGTFRLDARWTADRYSVRFKTLNPSENGVMGFDGTLAARRVGDCPG